LESILKGWQEEIEKRGAALQTKYEEYQKQSNMLNESAKQAKQKELVEEEQKLNQYRQEKQQELKVQQEKIMKPIQEKGLQSDRNSGERTETGIRSGPCNGSSCAVCRSAV
jgi:hypothetical protein